MQSEMRLHRIPALVLTVFLIIFITVVSRITPSLSNEWLEEVASLTIVILASSIFVVMGVLDEVIAFQFTRQHKREFWAYLGLGLISLATGLVLALSHRTSLQTIALVAAPHAFLFGLAELRVGANLGHHKPFRRSLVVGGVAEVGFGFALLYASSLSNQETVTVLSFVAIITTLQLIPFVVYSPMAIPPDSIAKEGTR